MAIVQSEALVLRSFRLGETSLIVSLFTREFGLLRCVAKGARGSKSRFGASLEPGVRVNAVVYRKLSRDLQLLSKTDIVEVLPALWEDPYRFAVATQVLEFLERAAYGESGDPELLDLACETLRTMSRAPIASLELIVRGFEIQACERLGYAPELTVCLECRSPLHQGGLFHPIRGGLLCGTCGGGEGSFRLSERARRVMVGLSEEPIPTLAGWAAERYPGIEVAKAVERFLAAHLERFDGLRASRVAESLGQYKG
ncbi:MAG: DNA repair protein RecO [Candidatus Eisenbacteria bacterium]|uniref:DNA repair protein RecO n=1 Tax=Eiseniibacteriota bacterium TaxID=2212470 RepID=A0A538TFJ0_UNCEI|nr:MAG: DNA repair protein RecO [Candidatus Eisenbacteria bacterium]